MPCIMCSYCRYLGQGKDMSQKYADVLNHEETCSEKTEDSEWLRLKIILFIEKQ